MASGVRDGETRTSPANRSISTSCFDDDLREPRSPPHAAQLIEFVEHVSRLRKIAFSRPRGRRCPLALIRGFKNALDQEELGSIGFRCAGKDGDAFGGLDHIGKHGFVQPNAAIRMLLFKAERYCDVPACETLGNGFSRRNLQCFVPGRKTQTEHRVRAR